MFKMNRKLLILTLTLLFPISTLAALDPSTVAIVNGKKISKGEFDRRYKENIQIFRFTPPTKQNVLNDIINFELAVQEAKKMGLDKRPDIQERLDAVLYQSLVETTLAEKFKKAVDVSEKEARDYCQKNPEIRTSHVYVALKPAALKAEEEAAMKKIRAAQADLAAGKSFEQAVASHSEGYATQAGGDIGFQAKDRLEPSYYKEALKLNVGEFTKSVVRSQFGLHIIKLVSKRPCSEINIADWQRMVYDEKRGKIFEDYVGNLRNKAQVSINSDLVKE